MLRGRNLHVISIYCHSAKVAAGLIVPSRESINISYCLREPALECRSVVPANQVADHTFILNILIVSKYHEANDYHDSVGI